MLLEDICDIYSGYAIKEFNEDKLGIPVIKISNILKDGTVELNECQYTIEKIDQKYHSQYDDIYIALSGATTGKIGILKSYDKFIINQRVGIVRKKENNIPIDFIKYFLFYYTGRIFKEASGCAQPNISPKQIGKYILPRLDGDNVKFIVEMLESLTNIIKKRKEQLNYLDELRRARFVEMFGDIVGGDYKYETCKLGDVSKIGSSHRVFTTEFVDDGIPFYRGTEIGELANGQQPTVLYYISEEHYKRLANDDTKPQIGDLLMPSICNKGQVWMVDSEEPFYYKDGRVLAISPDRNVFNSRFLQYFMREKTLVEYPKIGSGSTFAEFKIFLLKDLDVLIPPREIQDIFSDFVLQINKSKFIT